MARPVVSAGPGGAATVEFCRTKGSTVKKLNSATDLFESIEVDLWGPTYSVRQPTRAIERKVQAIVEKMEAMPDDTADAELIDSLCDLLDVFLEPLPDEDGKKTHAKTVIRKMYQDEKIGLAHVEALFERISALRAERPT